LCFITAPQMGYTLHSDASPLNKTVSHKKRWHAQHANLK
jgi:hypothetical protein